MEDSSHDVLMQLTDMFAKGCDLEEVLDAAMRDCERCHPEACCSVLLLDPDRRTLRHAGAPSLPAAYIKAIDGESIGPCAGSCGTAAYRGEPVYVEDIKTDPLWRDYRAAAEPYGFRACWSTPIFDSTGRVVGTFAAYFHRPGLPNEEQRGYLRLITRICGIAIAACRAECEKREVFERISEYFIALDRDLRITYANAKAAELLSATPRDLRGKRLDEAVQDAHEQEFYPDLQKSLADQRPSVGEFHYAPLRRWFERRIYPGPDGLTVYFHDITERKQVEERLRQAEKLTAIGQLAGGVAHDFNNQLSVILGYAGLLENRLADPETKRFATAILRAANRSGDLTRNLLAFSRQGNYENVAVDLHELIAEICELLSHSLDPRIGITRILNARKPVVTGDPATLQNALLNLALNARDAMPNGGRLVFATEDVTLPLPPGSAAPWRAEASELPPGPYLRVEVSDNGTGMTEAVRKRVFEPFFTTKPVGKGTGLGLASVFGTIKTHKGRIAVETEEGKGTAFHLLLPLAPRAGNDESVGRAAAPAQGITVLVVDDDLPVREIMKDMLRAGGHTVLEASGGREALALFRARGHEINLVILDLMMADLDGSATFLELRKLDPAVRVLLSTGFPGDAKIPSLMAAGVKGLLQKPYEKSHLDRMIALAMG